MCRAIFPHWIPPIFTSERPSVRPQSQPLRAMRAPLARDSTCTLDSPAQCPRPLFRSQCSCPGPLPAGVPRSTPGASASLASGFSGRPRWSTSRLMVARSERGRVSTSSAAGTSRRAGARPSASTSARSPPRSTSGSGSVSRSPWLPTTTTSHASPPSARRPPLPSGTLVSSATPHSSRLSPTSAHTTPRRPVLPRHIWAHPPPGQVAYVAPLPSSRSPEAVKSRVQWPNPGIWVDPFFVCGASLPCTSSRPSCSVPGALLQHLHLTQALRAQDLCLPPCVPGTQGPSPGSIRQKPGQPQGSAGDGG